VLLVIIVWLYFENAIIAQQLSEHTVQLMYFYMYFYKIVQNREILTIFRKFIHYEYYVA